jgi:hypothetical protein
VPKKTDSGCKIRDRGEPVELTPTQVRLPEQRAASDHLFPPGTPSSDPQFSAAAIAEEFRYANQTVVPAASATRRAAPAKKRGNDPVLVGALLVIGLVVSLALNAELILLRGTHHASASQPAVSIGNAAAQVDLSNLARAEATYFATSRAFTTDGVALGAAGYQPVAQSGVTVWAGVDNQGGFCGAAGGATSSAWYLYDTNRGGLVDHTYPSEQAAQLGCANHATMGFVVIP